MKPKYSILNISANADMLFSMRPPFELFKALGDETRLRIMVLLLDDNEYCVCDLMEALSLPQSKVSRHLASLKNNGWVTGRRQNKWMYYRINAEMDSLQEKIVSALRATLPTTSLAKQDQEKMRDYLKNKKGNTCN